jgi:hypothetical protein
MHSTKILQRKLSFFRSWICHLTFNSYASQYYTFDALRNGEGTTTQNHQLEYDIIYSTVEYLFKARPVKPAETAVARQQIRNTQKWSKWKQFSLLGRSEATYYLVPYSFTCLLVLIRIIQFNSLLFMC